MDRVQATDGGAEARTVQDLAGELFDAFTTMARGDETITVIDDAHELAEEARSIVYDAHAGMLPDDWTFEQVRAVLGAVHDGEIDPGDGAPGEWADSQVDVYNHARLQWLATYPGAVEACDEARGEGLTGEAADLLEQIGVGQYYALNQIAGSVCMSLLELFDSEGDES